MGVSSQLIIYNNTKLLFYTTLLIINKLLCQTGVFIRAVVLICLYGTCSYSIVFYLSYIYLFSPLIYY